MSDSAATCQRQTWRKQVNAAVTMYDYIQDAAYLNPGHVLFVKLAVWTISDLLPIHCHDLFG